LEVEPVVRAGVTGTKGVVGLVGVGVLRSTRWVEVPEEGIDEGGGGRPVVGSSSTLRFFAVATAFAFPTTASAATGTFDQYGTRGKLRLDLHFLQFQPVEIPASKSFDETDAVLVDFGSEVGKRAWLALNFDFKCLPSRMMR